MPSKVWGRLYNPLLWHLGFEEYVESSGRATEICECTFPCIIISVTLLPMVCLPRYYFSHRSTRVFSIMNGNRFLVLQGFQELRSSLLKQLDEASNITSLVCMTHNCHSSFAIFDWDDLTSGVSLSFHCMSFAHMQSK